MCLQISFQVPPQKRPFVPLQISKACAFHHIWLLACFDCIISFHISCYHFAWQLCYDPDIDLDQGSGKQFPANLLFVVLRLTVTRLSFNQSNISGPFIHKVAINGISIIKGQGCRCPQYLDLIHYWNPICRRIFLTWKPYYHCILWKDLSLSFVSWKISPLFSNQNVLKL